MHSFGTIENIKIKQDNTIIKKYKKTVKDIEKRSEEAKTIVEILESGDLKPGVYEGDSDTIILPLTIKKGGFKLWECSIDLIEYLAETIIKPQLQSNIQPLKGQSVLEVTPNKFCSNLPLF